jgi:peroxiredoxin
MENTTPREGALHMSGHVGAFHVLACVLVALALVTPGCSQSDSPDNRASGQAGAEADALPPDLQASPPSDESGVKLATAESRIRPPQDAAGEPDDAEPAPSDHKRPEPPAKLPLAQTPLPLDSVDAADLKMPKVILTEQHAATCRLGVGDTFPDFELADLEGRKQKFSQLLGDKLTLAVFWNGLEPIALEELADLARYYQPRFGDLGLAIVAINTGDDAQLAGELAQQAGAQFAVLSDADGAAFHHVATEKVPRTYLLDPSGTILWFDLEYSATTRRDMVEAIRYSLAH